MAANQITVKLDRVRKVFRDFIAVNELSVSVRAGRVRPPRPERGGQDHHDSHDGQHHRARFRIDRSVRTQDRFRVAEPHRLPAEERGLYRRMKVGDQLRFFAELKNRSRQDG